MLHLSLSLTLPLHAVLHQLTAAVKGYHDSQPVSAVENKGIHLYLQAPLVHICYILEFHLFLFFTLDFSPSPLSNLSRCFFPPPLSFPFISLNFCLCLLNSLSDFAIGYSETDHSPQLYYLNKAQHYFPRQMIKKLNFFFDLLETNSILGTLRFYSLCGLIKESVYLR